MNEIEVLYPEAQVTEIIQRRDAVIEALRQQGGQIISDLEIALNLIVDYQRHLGVMNAADPSWYEARELLHKYGLEGNAPKGGKIFVGATDITVDPFSEATAEEVVVEEIEEMEVLGLPEETDE